MVEIVLTAQSHNLSSWRRGVIVTSIAIAAVIIAAAIIVSVKSREQTIENSRLKLSAVSRLTAERTSQTFSAADLLVRSIQDSILKPSMPDEAALRNLVRKRGFFEDMVVLQKLLPQLEIAAVTDSDGNVLVDTKQFPAPQINIRNNGAFEALKANPELGLAFAPIQIDTLNHHWVLYLARALKDDKGRFIGIAEVGIPISYFENYLSTVNSGPDTSLTLSNSDRLVIARWPRIESAIGKSILLSKPTQSIEYGETSVFSLAGADGKMRLIASTRFDVNKIQFHLGATQTESALLEPWRSVLVWIAVFSVFSLLVLATLMTYMLRAIRDEGNWNAAILERERRLSQQAAELLTARDVAESANRIRGLFLANMSHELRTPLNAVLGFSEILQKELFGPLGDPRYMEFVGDIHSSGKHLLDIISNILDLAKVDAGKLELREEVFDIVELIKNSARLIADAARNADVTFELHVPDYAVMFHGDSIRLRQILLNLLSNAVKFTPAGKNVILSCEMTYDGFVMRVIDSGIGMTKEEIVQAMQVFGQIDSSFSRRYQGTGLGLPLTKSLVDLHNGVMTVDSESGKGTIVTVCLPDERIVRSDKPEEQSLIGISADGSHVTGFV